MVASAPEPLSEPQMALVRPESNSDTDYRATRPPSREADVGKKATAKLKMPGASQRGGEQVSSSGPIGYFTIGSSKDEVLAIQGTPSSVIGNSFLYGYSSVDFQGDRVSGYSNISKNLKVRLTSSR